MRAARQMTRAEREVGLGRGGVGWVLGEPGAQGWAGFIPRRWLLTRGRHGCGQPGWFAIWMAAGNTPAQRRPRPSFTRSKAARHDRPPPPSDTQALLSDPTSCHPADLFAEVLPRLQPEARARAPPEAEGQLAASMRAALGVWDAAWGSDGPAAERLREARRLCEPACASCHRGCLRLVATVRPRGGLLLQLLVELGEHVQSLCSCAVPPPPTICDPRQAANSQHTQHGKRASTAPAPATAWTRRSRWWPTCSGAATPPPRCCTAPSTLRRGWVARGCGARSAFPLLPACVDRDRDRLCPVVIRGGRGSCRLAVSCRRRVCRPRAAFACTNAGGLQPLGGQGRF
jgi:hypothetical protein